MKIRRNEKYETKKSSGNYIDWWIEVSQGDVVSYLPCLEKHKEEEKHSNRKIKI